MTERKMLEQQINEFLGNYPTNDQKLLVIIIGLLFEIRDALNKKV